MLAPSMLVDESDSGDDSIPDDLTFCPHVGVEENEALVDKHIADLVKDMDVDEFYVFKRQISSAPAVLTFCSNRPDDKALAHQRAAPLRAQQQRKQQQQQQQQQHAAATSNTSPFASVRHPPTADKGGPAKKSVTICEPMRSETEDSSDSGETAPEPEPEPSCGSPGFDGAADGDAASAEKKKRKKKKKKRKKKSGDSDEPPVQKRADVHRDAPCSHNGWDRVAKKKNSISLKCRTCRAYWKTCLEFFTKCPDFYAGECRAGDSCPHPHIYSKAAEKHQRVKEGITSGSDSYAVEGDGSHDDDPTHGMMLGRAAPAASLHFGGGGGGGGGNGVPIPSSGVAPVDGDEVRASVHCLHLSGNQPLQTGVVQSFAGHFTQYGGVSWDPNPVAQQQQQQQQHHQQQQQLLQLQLQQPSPGSPACVYPFVAGGGSPVESAAGAASVSMGPTTLGAIPPAQAQHRMWWCAPPGMPAGGVQGV